MAGDFSSERSEETSQLLTKLVRRRIKAMIDAIPKKSINRRDKRKGHKNTFSPPKFIFSSPKRRLGKKQQFF